MTPAVSIRRVVVLAAAALMSACSTTISPSGTPRPTPAPTGPAADLQSLFIPAPAGYSRLPDNHKQGIGYETLDDAAGGVSADRQRLTNDGFAYGYVEGFTRPQLPILLQIAIVKYAGSSGANDAQTLVAANNRSAVTSGETFTTFDVPSVPGAMGMQLIDTAKNRAEYAVIFARGRYHVDIYLDNVVTPATAEDDPVAMRALAMKVAAQEYALIPG